MSLVDFLGIKKFGQGIASTIRLATGEVRRDREASESGDMAVQKLVYAARQEKDPNRKTQLLKLAKNLGSGAAVGDIDRGLNLSNKEIIGSAANVGLNMLTPGAFKGGKAAIIAKNAALGGAFGGSSGLENNRPGFRPIGSVVGGAIVGAGLGTASVAVNVAKNFFTRTTPEWMMNHAVKPALNDLKKNVRYGTDTLGKQLLKEGVTGGPKRLLEIADQQLKNLENELIPIIESPALAQARISRHKIQPYIKELLERKRGVPGLENQVQRIKDIFKSLPEKMSLPEANALKRKIYTELQEPAYKIDAKLSVKSQALKQIARGLKTEIENTVGGTVVKDINQKLSIYGRLQDRITDQMARAMRNNAFSLSDMLILTAGGASALIDQEDQTRPLGLLAALAAIFARHNSTAIYTSAAKVLNKAAEVGPGAAMRAGKEITRRGILNIP